MRIGVDIMGGDYAPLQTTLGAIAARGELDPQHELVLIGDEKVIRDIMRAENADESRFSFVHTTEVIGMADNPTKAFQQKPDSSIAVGFRMLKEKPLMLLPVPAIPVP